MSRAVDLLITYRIIKLLTTPFEKQEELQIRYYWQEWKSIEKTKELKTGKEGMFNYTS